VVKGVEYQQGSRWIRGRGGRGGKVDRTHADCGTGGVALNIDHIRPKASGGSNGVSNVAFLGALKDRSLVPRWWEGGVAIAWSQVVSK